MFATRHHSNLITTLGTNKIIEMLHIAIIIFFHNLNDKGANQTVQMGIRLYR